LALPFVCAFVLICVPFRVDVERLLVSILVRARRAACKKAC
jgi:hypothetical protein